MTLLDDAPEGAVASYQKPGWRWLFGALALLVLLVGLAGGSFQGKLGDVQKNDNSAFLPDSADSTKVNKALESYSSIQSIPGFIVFQREDGRAITHADQQAVAARADALRKVKGVSADEVRALQPGRSGKVIAIQAPLIGKSNGVTVKGPELVDTEKAVIAAAKKGMADYIVHSAGPAGVLVAFIDAFDGLDGALLLAAAVVVIVILLFVYRSPVLWFFPLLCAVVALGAASIVIYALAKSGTITLNGQSQGILSVLVIGAGTDYALLLISRYREDLHEYDSRLQAMISAWRGVAPPVVASGLTVMIGLLCLTVADLNSTAGLGPVCAIGIACTVIVQLTVLPALLVLSGRWIFWPKRPNVDHQTDLLQVHGIWGRFAQWLEGKRRPAWLGAAVILAVCVAAISTLKTDGLSTEDSFTSKPEAVVGQDIYNANYAQGSAAPVVILAAKAAEADVIAAVRKVQGIEGDAPDGVCPAADFAKVGAAVKKGQVPQFLVARTCPPAEFQAVSSDHPEVGQIRAELTDAYDSAAARATIDRIRAAVKGVPSAHALVGGQTAVNHDIQSAARRDNSVIIPLVLAVIFVILALLLRALVAPVLLIATVVLSFAAALGVSAVVFNHVFNFANADPGFPLFAFVFLVALGIDYNIFLMTRVREETLGHGTHAGITRGLAVTGGVITSAGVVLAATFVVLGVLPIVFLAEIGFAVAFGVLLDTIVVRSILVPALAHEIGRKIWWPSKLASAAD